MAKGKKKKARAAQELHQRHHQSVQDFIRSQTPTDQHLMPMAQPWHMNEPWCFCVPRRSLEHPVTRKVVWVHRYQIH